jgi:mannosyltransferase
VNTLTVAERPQYVETRAEPSGRRVSRYAVAVVVLTILAAVVRFVGLSHQSYWFDEADTVSILHTSLGGLLTRVPRWETTPPFYFVLAWLWSHLFGYGEAGLRSLSALAGVLTVPVGYATGRQFFSRRVGVIVAALIACNPLLVWYAQEARAYALLVLLTSVALLAFAYLRIRLTGRWMAIWTVASALALATHYYAALVIVPEAIFLLARYGKARQVRICVLALAIWGLPIAAIALRQLQHNLGISNWINRIPLLLRVQLLPKEFAIGPSGPVSGWWVLVAAIVAGLSAWLAVRRASSDERRSIRFLLLLAASGFGIVAALVLLGFDQVNTRNLLALWLPSGLVVAAGLGVRRAGALGVAGVAALCAIGIATVIAVAVNPAYQRPAWRSVAHAIDSDTTRAVFAINGCQTLPLSLYVPGLRYAAAGGTAVREIDVIAAADQTDWYKVLVSGGFVVCKPQPHSVAIPQRLGSFHAVGPVVRINNFSVLRLRSAVPVRVTQRTFSAAGLSGAFMVAPPGH